MKLLLLFSFVVSVYCLGNWRKVKIDHENVVEAAHFGSKSLSSRMNSLFHVKLVAINDAEMQTVAGVNYRLDITVGTTNCKKTEVDYKEIETCDFQEKSSPQRCVIVVYRNLNREFKVTKFNCAPASESHHEDDENSMEVERTMFSDFMTRFKKTYKDEIEKETKFRTFQQNLKKIKLLNDHERGTAKYGITEFSDLTEEEFKATKLGFRPDLLQEYPPKASIPNAPLPTSFDWREKKVVSEVKNQGSCGSCWAFSTTGNIEGQWAIKKQKLVSLSEQELVDCDKVDQGCNGGLPSNAYKEIIRLGGLEGESDYPYEGDDEKCQFKKKEVQVFINSSVAISSNETEMAMWLVKNGPISIGINANAMQFYYGGVSHPWKFLCNPKNLDHGVLIVGFGVHNYPLFNTTLPFWIVKNSWGANWGEQGYYRVYRGDGTCGLNTMATSSIID